MKGGILKETLEEIEGGEPGISQRKLHRRSVVFYTKVVSLGYSIILYADFILAFKEGLICKSNHFLES